MTTTPKSQANRLDKILKSFGEDVADQYGDGLVGLDTAKQAIQALITEAKAIESDRYKVAIYKYENIHDYSAGSLNERIGELKENK